MSDILLVDSFYPKFLKRFEPTVDSYANFDEVLQSFFESGFGTTGVLVKEFNKIGWDAHGLICNSELLINKWRSENNLSKAISFGWNHLQFSTQFPLLPRIYKFFPHFHSSLISYVRKIQPKYLLIQDLNLFHPTLTKELKKNCEFLIGEIASPLPSKKFIAQYDLIFSALPSIVDQINELGVRSVNVSLGFDHSILKRIEPVDRDIDISFIGSSGRHWNTFELLGEVKKEVPTLHIYGNMNEKELRKFNLLENYKGEAWGNQMFEILNRSKISLNRHGKIAGDFAVNMRMYESTGMGALLLTENKKYLSQNFDPQIEVATYENPWDAARKSLELLKDPERLISIARAGQLKTLSSHTYSQRVKSMAESLSSLT